MKIALVKPCWSFPIGRSESTYNRIWPPLSLANSAALLRRAGHAPLLVDAAARRLDPEATAGLAAGADLAIVTSASLDRWQCPNIDLAPFLAVVAALRRRGLPVFVCGTHGTVRPTEILALSGADGVIRGEPEETILELAEHGSPAGVAGLTRPGPGGPVHEPERGPLDLTALPLPAFDLLDFGAYRYEVLGDRFALLEASRGCPYACSFCVKATYGPTYRRKTLAQVAAEMDELLDRHQVRSAYVIDLEFTLNRDLAAGFCEHLLARNAGLRWCCQTRADAVDPELLRLMRRAGCRIVHFGVESGSPRLAATLGKRMRFDEIRRGLELTRRAGIDTVGFFLFGLPTETESDVRRTIRLACRLNPTYASFHIAQPYPGTVFHEQVAAELGPELFPSAYTGVISERRLRALARRAFLTFYLRPGYLAARLQGGDLRSLARQARFFWGYFWHRLGFGNDHGG